MTIEEKMEHFKSVSLENASKKSNDILTAYKHNLDEEFEKHKVDATLEYQAIEESKLAAVRLKAKRELVKEQTSIKRNITLHQNELKARLFKKVMDKLAEYKKTDAYKELLVKQISSVLSDFKNDEIIFYIDPSDEALMDYLISQTSADIQVGNLEFLGGTKAIISERNILVDNSFKTRLSEEQEKFTISF